MSLYVAGFNGYGELGLGHRSPCHRFTAVDVMAAPTEPLPLTTGSRTCALVDAGVVAVAAGPSKTYCLLHNGVVLESGGGGSEGSNRFAPVARLSHNVGPIVGIAATALELVAIAQRTVYVLPSAVGVAAASVRSFPLPQPQTDGRFVAVAAGSVFAVVLCHGGTLYAFGINAYGQLGIGLDDLDAVKDGALHRIWLPDTDMGERPTAIACGGCHAVALTNQGNVYVWGNNDSGQLGVEEDASGRTPPPPGSHRINRAILCPRRVVLPQRIRAVACGDYHTVLLTVADEAHRAAMYVAGRNHCGQLTPWVGQPTPLSTPAPPSDDVVVFTPVALPASIVPVSVAGGGGHGCSHTLLADINGVVWAFGSNVNGQLGSAKASSRIHCGEGEVMVFDGLAAPHRDADEIGVPGPCEVRVAAGWRTSFVYRAAPVASQASDSTTSPRLSMDHVLPPDVLDHMAQYLQVKDARQLLSVCRILNATVRYCCPVWKAMVEAKCPFSAAAARREQQRHLDTHGQDAEIDWVALLGASCGHRYGQLTPFPCSTTLRSDASGGVFARVAAAWQAATTSFARTVATLAANISGRSPGGNNGRRVLFTGLDAAGKTTILYYLKLGEPVTTIPTIGFNVETVAHDGSEFVCWDVGGPDKIRPLWRHYYQDTRAHVFVVDANDKQRMAEAARECGIARSGGLSHVPLLVLANKQDLPGALSVEQVAAAFQHATPCALTGVWCVQGVSARSGEGLMGCLEWLAWAVQQPEPPQGDAATTGRPS